MAAKRRGGVVSVAIQHRLLERDENQILAQTRDLSASLSAANERVAKAEGRYTPSLIRRPPAKRW